MTNGEIEHIEGAAALDRDTANNVRKTVTRSQFWAGIVLTICATYVCTNVKAMYYGLDLLGHEGHAVGELVVCMEKWEARALDAESKLEHRAWLDENWQIALGLIHDNSLCLERTKMRCGLEFKNWNPALRGGFIDTAVAADKTEVLEWITEQDGWSAAAGIKANSILTALGLEQGAVAAR